MRVTSRLFPPISISLLSVALISAAPVDLKPVAKGYPSGAAIIARVKGLKEPLGYDALSVYQKLKTQNFDANRNYSNDWIRAQLAFYDAADADYKTYMKEMVEGSSEGGLSMRHWLSDPQNVATWDAAIQKLVGDEGYARVVAINGAFPKGSAEYRLVYGGKRRFDPATNSLWVNGTKFSAPSSKKPPHSFDASADEQHRFDYLTRYGDAVRQQIFHFYENYSAGKVKPAQVAAFNAAYIRAGGCALANTETPTQQIGARYLTALKQFAQALGEFGYPVSTPG